MSNILSVVWNFIERIAKKIVYSILGIIGISIKDEQWHTFMQFVKFGIVGLSNTFISYAVYVIAVLCGANYFVGNLLGFVISVLNSFYWNNKYVFKKEAGRKRSWIKTLIKTFISYGATGLVLSSALLYIWIDLLGIPELVAPIINLLITIPLNFVLNKVWAFKQTRE